MRKRFPFVVSVFSLVVLLSLVPVTAFGNVFSSESMLTGETFFLTTPECVSEGNVQGAFALWHNEGVENGAHDKVSSIAKTGDGTQDAIMTGAAVGLISGIIGLIVKRKNRK